MDLNQYFGRKLRESGLNLDTSSARMQHIDKLKSDHCYMALNFDDELLNTEMSYAKGVTANLVDGTSVWLNDLRFRVPELIFKPAMAGLELNGLAKLLYESIMAFPIDTRRYVATSIVISRRNSMFQGIPERLEKQPEEVDHPGFKPRVVAVPERKYLNWIGGSIVGSLSSTKHHIFTKSEFDECGSVGILKRGSNILRIHNCQPRVFM